MRRFLALAGLMLFAARVGAEESALLNATQLQFSSQGGSVIFKKESGATNLLDPTCPGPSAIRIVTTLKDTGELPLDCRRWSFAKGKYIYSDPAGAVLGLQSILWKSTKMNFVFGGSTYAAAPITGGAGVNFIDVQLSIGPDKYGQGPDKYCARFTSSNFTVNLSSLLIAAGPSHECPGEVIILPTDTPTATGPTNTPTITNTPTDSPSPTPTITQGGPTLTPTPQGPTAYRITSLSIQDPAIQVFGCGQVANALVASIISGSISSDKTVPADGILDLNLISLFRPLDEAASNGNIDVGGADCTIAPTTCHQSIPSGLQSTTYSTLASGTCLSPVAGTLGKAHGNTPYFAIKVPTAPCYVTSPINSSFNLGGIVVPLSGSQFGATFNDPTNGLINGLIMGFITETTANATVIPSSMPLVGGHTLASLLQGSNCPSNDDRDTYLGESGWWFYLNFTATQAPWTSP